MTNPKVGTSLDSAFETAVRSMAVLDSVMLRESYQACIKEGGDPLACWLQQETLDGMLIVAPPPEFPDETGAGRALIMMRASIEQLIATLESQKEKPSAPAPVDAVTASLRTKAILDMWKRMKEIEACHKGEGDPFECWHKYGIWIFPWPRPLHPDWLKGIPVSQALAQMHSAAVALLDAIALEIEAWGPGKP